MKPATTAAAPAAAPAAAGGAASEDVTAGAAVVQDDDDDLAIMYVCRVSSSYLPCEDLLTRCLCDGLLVRYVNDILHVSFFVIYIIMLLCYFCGHGVGSEDKQATGKRKREEPTTSPSKKKCA